MATIPRPKNDCHHRLTATRAVSGCFGSVSHCARPSRLRGHEPSNGGKAAGVPGSTRSPGASYAPRLSKNVGRGRGISFITMISATGSTSALRSFRRAVSAARRLRYSASTFAR